MRTKVDGSGRIVLPKPMRDHLGLTAGTVVDVTVHGAGVYVSRTERTARLEQRGEHLVAVSNTGVTDDDLYNVLDSIRQ